MSRGAVNHEALADLLVRVTIVEEDQETRDLIDRLAHVASDHVLSRSEFLDICYWKSPRSTHHCRRNSTQSIKRASQEVFRTPNEQRKMELLTTLKGVSIPTASAILTLTNPDRYGVIDIRVWQLLHAIGAVRRNPAGRGFTTGQWLEYLELLRAAAKKLNVSVRLVELTLFTYHRDRAGYNRRLTSPIHPLSVRRYSGSTR